MFPRPYFLSSSGPLLPEDVLNVLFDYAQEMIRSGKTSYNISGATFDGRITTKHEVKFLVAVYGIYFIAELYIDGYDAMARSEFIVRKAAFGSEDLLWMTISPEVANAMTAQLN